MATPDNTSLDTVGDDARVFTGLSRAGLWFSLGVGLLAMRTPDDALPPPIDLTTAGLWLLGVIVLHGAATWAPPLGSALPCLLLNFGLARLTQGKAH